MNLPATRESEVVHEPHRPLTQYYDDQTARERWVRETFNETAPDYDRIERLAAFGSGSWYRRRALARCGLKAGMRVADIGIGTGLVAREAIRIIGDAALLTGVDPSVGMMKNAPLPKAVQLIEGKAESIPLPDGSVDFVSMGYALRHIADLAQAFNEFHRILKPGGVVCMLEITPPAGRVSNALLKFYMRGVVPLLPKLLSRRAQTPVVWRYFWDTIEACAPPQSVMSTLQHVGFNEVTRYVELGIFSEYRAVKLG